MKIAIMQPYFFPYIGYFELMREVDMFVFLTDVQYIRRGWVNRNRIRSNTTAGWQYLTVPVQACPQATLIRNVKIAPDWFPTHRKRLQCLYGTDPKSRPVLSYYEQLAQYKLLSPLLTSSLMWTARQLGIQCEFRDSGGITGRHKADRLVDICRCFGAKTYVNLSGGQRLYTQADFGKVKLQFMPPTQYLNKLSILDLLLTEPQKCRDWLERPCPRLLASDNTVVPQ